MTITAYSGTFATGTGAVSSTVVVTGVGFQPSALLFYWVGRTESVDTIGRASHERGFGFAISPTSRRAACCTSADGGASSDGGGYHSDAACVLSCDHAGAIDGALDLQSMDSDGFTLIVDDVFPRDQRIGYLALGGLTNVATGQFTTPAATGTQDITTVGFQPDAVLLIGVRNDVAPPDGQATNSGLSIGGMVSASMRGTHHGSQDDGSATMDTGAYCIGSECLAIGSYSTPTTLVSRGDFSAWLSNGFRINWSVVDTAQADYCHYLALQGGSYTIGSVLTQTDTTTAIVASGFGFTPAAALFVSACRAQSTAGSGSVHDQLSIGAAHSTSARNAQAYLDENGTANAEVTTALEFDAVYANISAASAIQGLMDMQSFDSDGFTCIMDDADPSQSFVWYFAAGNAASAAAIPRSLNLAAPSFPTYLEV